MKVNSLESGGNKRLCIYIYFKLEKIYAFVIFDYDQFGKVYSSGKVCHLVIHESLCQNFCECFSLQNFLPSELSGPKGDSQETKWAKTLGNEHYKMFLWKWMTKYIIYLNF